MILRLLGYSKWQDIMVFGYEYQSHLLQGCKNKYTGKTRLKIVSINCKNFRYHQCHTMTQEQLEKAGLWESGNDEELKK